MNSQRYACIREMLAVRQKGLPCPATGGEGAVIADAQCVATIQSPVSR